MRRLIALLAVIALWAAPASAQNNSYDIDDVCYEYFRMAENLVSDVENDAFEYANNALLKRAEEVNDEKARTLYYVTKLKRVIRRARLTQDRSEANLMVDQQKKETTEVARQTGYMQYYYYAYQLCQTYYMNTRQEAHAQALIQEMMDIATRNGEEYGIWQSHTYISVLFLHQNDILKARKHLLRSVEIYENTNDEVVKRQSIARQYCDLASTYTFGSDSARFYIRRGEQASKTPGDTIRVVYYKAQLAAFDHDVENYRRYRDACLNDPALPELVIGASSVFPGIEAIMAGAPRDSIIAKVSKVASRQQMVCLRGMAAKYNRDDIAAWVGSMLIESLYEDISRFNDMKMEELSTSVQHRQLTMALERQKRLNSFLWVALAVLLAGIIGLGSMLFANKKKNHIQ